MKHLWWIIVGGSGALLALLLMWQTPASSQRSSQQLMTLLTLCSDTLAIPPASDVYAIAELKPYYTNQSFPENLVWIKSPEELAQLSLRYQQMYVLGAGLPSHFLQQIDTGKVHIEWRSGLCEGLQYVELSPKYLLDSLELRLEWAGEPQVHVMLPSGKVDTLRSSESAGFHRLYYRLGFSALSWMPIGVIYAEDTVWVNQPALSRGSARLLVLEGGPQAETRFLRNWIKKQGGYYASRTQLAPQQYTEEWHMPQAAQPLHPLTPDLLKQFDWMLIDEAAWQVLSAKERAYILSEVRYGLGVLWLWREGSAQLPSRKLLPYRTQSLRNAVYLLNGTPLGELSLNEWRIKGAEGTIHMVKDERGEGLFLLESYGKGKLAITVIDNSFHWFLSGKTATYQQYWLQAAHLLARPSPITAYWQLPSVAFVQNKTRFRLRSPVPPARAYVIANNAQRYHLQLTASVADSLWWIGYWYAPKPGLCQWVAQSAQDETLAQQVLWISKKPQAWRAYEHFRITKRWLVEDYEKKNRQPAFQPKQLPSADSFPLWGWALLAFSLMLLLWIKERLARF